MDLKQTSVILGYYEGVNGKLFFLSVVTEVSLREREKIITSY